VQSVRLKKKSWSQDGPLLEDPDGGDKEEGIVTVLVHCPLPPADVYNSWRRCLESVLTVWLWTTSWCSAETQLNAGAVGTRGTSFRGVLAFRSVPPRSAKRVPSVLVMERRHSLGQGR
jgi:hypothetical protein